MTSIHIRRLQPTDSKRALLQLADVLTQALAPLVEHGLFSAARLTPEALCQDLHRGHCLVAVSRGLIVGSVTVRGSDQHSGIAVLDRLAVAPAFQHAGVGVSLLRAAEAWAWDHHYRGLELQAPAPALRLRDFLCRHGFRARQTLQTTDLACGSVVMSKPVLQPARRAAATEWPARHPAEMALLGRRAAAAARRVSTKS